MCTSPSGMTRDVRWHAEHRRLIAAYRREEVTTLPLCAGAISVADVSDGNSALRLKDMDAEGVDHHVIIPGARTPTAT